MIQKTVGISFRPTKNGSIKVGSPISLRHDKGNEFSSKSIAVTYHDEETGETISLGFIGERGNDKHEEIFNALPLEGKVYAMNRLLKGEVFDKFKEGEITRLEIEFPMASDTDGKLKSFNEDIWLTFSHADHRYVYQGKELTSGSRYIKRWIKEFDDEEVAKMCSRSYGYPAETIMEMWGKGGKVAAKFGTAIHDALDHYEKFKELGAVIQAKKDLPFNKALPSHPLLRKIVEDFYKLPLQEGEVVTEVLLTNVERGLCGQADRVLITGPMKCRVQDFKININADEIDKNIKFLGMMADLPTTKLSKYQMQMSVYARFLQLSGWEIEGLDAFVYEGTWKHFPMDVLKVDF